MKILMFNYRDDVEGCNVGIVAKKYGVTIDKTYDALSIENVSECKGYEAISIVGGSPLNFELLSTLKEIGVKYIATRSIGYDHINVTCAKELGLKVANGTYSPSSVADFAVTTMLMLTRKIPMMLEKGISNTFNMQGVQGKEMHNLTVGIIGTGKIGQTVIKRVAGFDSKILAYDLHQNEFTKQYATYTDLDTIFKQSDIISLHIPLTDDSKYLINEEKIDKMKDGVYIVNTARGELIDNKALIQGILDKKIGGVALDVVEGEKTIFRQTNPYSYIDSNVDFYTLKGLPNVMITPHKAFFTDQATYDMVENSTKALIKFMNGEDCELEITR